MWKKLKLEDIHQFFRGEIFFLISETLIELYHLRVDTWQRVKMYSSIKATFSLQNRNLRLENLDLEGFCFSSF